MLNFDIKFNRSAMKRLYLFFALLSISLVLVTVCFHLRFFYLPLFFLALGFLTQLRHPRFALNLFLFLLPLSSASADLFYNGYAFNLMALVIFYLAGFLLAMLARGEAFDFGIPWFKPYLLFLVILFVSAFFVFLRWSNITISFRAILQDTPVTPYGERVSFASIYPVISLFLFTISPLVYLLIRASKKSLKVLLRPLSLGYCLSVVVALLQKMVDADFMSQAWWGRNNQQFNGGFSDFNAFGFFSGVMLLAALVHILDKRPWSDWKWRDSPILLVLPFSLLGIVLSGCRTALIFVAAAMLLLIFSRRASLKVKLISLLLPLLFFILFGGTLKERIGDNLLRAKQLVSGEGGGGKLSQIANKRLFMVAKSKQMLAVSPVSGTGVGNYLFHLKFLFHKQYMAEDLQFDRFMISLGLVLPLESKGILFTLRHRFFHEKYTQDLALNQYLLILAETGIIGLIIFAWFLLRLLSAVRRPGLRFVLLTFLIALLFNNFLWFPEVMVLFWILVACAEKPAGRYRLLKSPGLVAAGLVLIFLFSQLLAFSNLHPVSWSRLTNKTYSYGFWQVEIGPDRRPFQWSGERCGFYLALDGEGRATPFSLNCSAPLAALGGRQTVDIYWRGKHLQRLEFETNGQRLIRISDKNHSTGLCELRVAPVFIPAKLGLSADERQLGVQILWPETTTVK